MKDKRFSIGIVGAGWVAGARHAPSYLKDGRARVEAIYDRDLAKAERLAQRFSVARATNNLDELLHRAKDAVSICTPPQSHAELALRAMKAGRHVLVEKPMAMTSDEARAMAATSRATGLQLCVSHNFLFSRSMTRARQMIDAGKVGEILHAVALQLSSPRRRLPSWYPELPGGLFFDEAPHMLYILRSLLGELHVRGAWAIEASDGGPQPIERLECSLDSGPRTAQLTMSFQAPVSEWLVLVVGSRSALVIDVFRDMLTVLGSDNRHGSGDVLRSSLSLFAQAAAGFAGSGALHATGRLYYGHDRLISRFLDGIDGEEQPVALGESLAVMGSMEEIMRTAGISRAGAKV